MMIINCNSSEEEIILIYNKIQCTGLGVCRRRRGGVLMARLRRAAHSRSQMS
jgi:hypothetical protein